MEQLLEPLFLEIRTEFELEHYRLTDQLQEKTRSLLTLTNANYDALVKDAVEGFFSDLAARCFVPETAIYLYSAAFSIQKSKSVFENMLALCQNEKESLAISSLYYLCNQFISIIFLTPELNQPSYKIKIQLLIDHVTQCYEKALQEILAPIPETERDDSLVVVLTEQFLSFQHGPSKSAADRCQILMERMGKKVILINTAELLSEIGQIPFINGRLANYDPNFSSMEFIEWKHCKIPFVQCGKNMPNLDDLRILVNLLQEIRPSFIISIGAGKIMAALASKLIPTLSIGMVFSDLAVTSVKYQALGRTLNEDDREFLSAVGKKEDDIIIGTFGFSINKQQTRRTRESLNLPSEAWLAAIVGARLDFELTDDFWKMAANATQNGLEFVLIGSFDVTKLEKIYASYPLLQGRVHCLGFVEDTSSYLELCDLYVNPLRRGGATSCVEAMNLGLPVITTSYGDVAVAAGETFWTDSYQTMPALLRRYLTDFDFYISQSTKAGERAATLLNAEENFVKIVEEFLNRMKK